MISGCRSCTENRKCASCKRRAASLAATDMQAMQTTYDFITQASAATAATTPASSCDTAGTDTGSFCGDM